MGCLLPEGLQRAQWLYFVVKLDHCHRFHFICINTTNLCIIFMWNLQTSEFQFLYKDLFFIHLWTSYREKLYKDISLRLIMDKSDFFLYKYCMFCTTCEIKLLNEIFSSILWYMHALCNLDRWRQNMQTAIIFKYSTNDRKTVGVVVYLMRWNQKETVYLK